MAKREIKEVLYFDEEEVKQALMDSFCEVNDNYDDWKISIDNSRTPAVIKIERNKIEDVE